MEPLVRKMTKSTPYICLDSGARTFLIAGRSIPLDADLFFKPVLHWLDSAYKAGALNNVQFVFRFDFFNIATSKRVLLILYKLLEIQRAGTQVTVRWMHEKYDLDMLEIGQDFSCMVDGLNFIYESYDLAELKKQHILRTG